MATRWPTGKNSGRSISYRTESTVQMNHDMSRDLRSAVITLAMGPAVEKLDHTFSSFALCPDVELHAFILGQQLPQRRLPQIQYHLLAPSPDFSDPLREIYFRRMEVLDELGVDFALTVDCFDVLCLQRLPPFEQLLGDADVAACVEHLGSRYIPGQGYTANFLNGGVFLWNVPRSRDIRSEIVARGRSHFRTVADDQHCINEVIQAKYFDRLRILPYQYNFRCNLAPITESGWPTVENLDGVMIYHNALCMEAAKKLPPVKSRALLPYLEPDGHALKSSEIEWRQFRNGNWKPLWWLWIPLWLKPVAWIGIVIAQIYRYLKKKLIKPVSSLR
jgi:hypothetical protein